VLTGRYPAEEARRASDLITPASLPAVTAALCSPKPTSKASKRVRHCSILLRRPSPPIRKSKTGSMPKRR